MLYTIVVFNYTIISARLSWPNIVLLFSKKFNLDDRRYIASSVPSSTSFPVK